MSDSEELNRLADLHQRGALSDEEFARAKDRVLKLGANGYLVKAEVDVDEIAAKVGEFVHA